MTNTNIQDIKRRADINSVWAALGGGKLRKNRGQAFWRGGTGYNVAIYPATGTWHDFVSGDGGDVVELVQTVRGRGFRDAVEWLGDFSGIHRDHHHHHDDDHHHAEQQAWATDLKWALWWKMSVELFAEWALEELPYWHHERRGLTSLLNAIRLGDASLVAEYRASRQREPVMTAGMAQAGRRLDARRQRKLALWLRRYLDEQQSA